MCWIPSRRDSVRRDTGAGVIKRGGRGGPGFTTFADHVRFDQRRGGRAAALRAGFGLVLGDEIGSLAAPTIMRVAHAGVTV